MAKTDLDLWKQRIRDAEETHKDGTSVLGAAHCDWRRYLQLFSGRTAELDELDRVIVNKIFPTIRILHSALASYSLRFDAQPTAAQYVNNARAVKAVMNYFYTSLGLDVQFARIILDALLFPMGWAKVGYSEELVLVPSAGATKKYGEDLLRVPQFSGDTDFSLYVRGGAPWLLRVSPFDIMFDPRANNYYDATWIAERMTRPLSHLKANPFYNTKGLEPTHYGRREPGVQEHVETFGTDHSIYEMVTYWEVHDMASGRMMVLSDQFDSWILPPESYPYGVNGSVYEPLVLFPCPDSYPISLTCQLEGLQVEKNELRNYQVIHSKRFNRKYIVRKGAFSEDELEKLENGDDGTIVQCKAGKLVDSIIPVPDANISPDLYQLDRLSDADFREVSAVDELTAGILNRVQTATANASQESKFRFRSLSQRNDIARFYSRCATKLLEITRERLSDTIFVPLTNPGDRAFFKGQFLEAGKGELSGTSDVQVQLVEAEPLTDNLKRQQLITVMQVLGPWANAPAIPPVIAKLLSAVLPTFGIVEVDEVADMLFQHTPMQAGGPQGQAQLGAQGVGNVPLLPAPDSAQAMGMGDLSNLLRLGGGGMMNSEGGIPGAGS